MKAAKIVNPAKDRDWKCAGAIGSRRLKWGLLAATALAVAAAPGLAHASSLVPDAAYANSVQATYAAPYPGEPPLGGQSTSSPTTGIGVNGAYPPSEYWTATTDNNYSIPSLQAAVRVTGDVKATAFSSLVYSVEFGGSAGSTVGIAVKAYGDADVFENKAGAYVDTSANGASALLYIMDPATQSVVFSIVANSDLSSHKGSHSFSVDKIYTFKANTVYRVFMDASASADYSHSAVAEVDPYFGVPDGYTFLISDGIGNAPLASTPIPAALPLFASGLGAFGLLGRCRKRKAAVTGA